MKWEVESRDYPNFTTLKHQKKKKGPEKNTPFFTIKEHLNM